MRNIAMTENSSVGEEDRFHAVIGGQTTEMLDKEEREICNFVLGGFFTK